MKVFEGANYTENFIQCILDSSDGAVAGSTLVVGGDGRYFCKKAAETIIRICAANGVSKLLVGKDAILSTPAVSSLIRRNKAYGGILLTASHNPGGPDNDFGIKFNCENGGPAPDAVTNKIYQLSTTITQYKIVDGLHINLSNVGVNAFDVNGAPFTVEIVDTVADYVRLMREIFDFDRLQAFVSGKKTGTPLKLRIDALNGGNYEQIRSIFVVRATLSIVNIPISLHFSHWSVRQWNFLELLESQSTERCPYDAIGRFWRIASRSKSNIC